MINQTMFGVAVRRHCGCNEMRGDRAKNAVATRADVSLILSIPMIGRRNCWLRATVLRRALGVCEPF
jgi:hypothetical protein